MKRREFLAGSLAAGAGLLAPGALAAAQRAAGSQTKSKPKKGESSMSFEQPKLPYALDALKPFLSEEQMSFHYGKHHAAYIKNLNGLVEGKPEAQMSLRELIVKTKEGPMFNNAAQAFNHTFFWECMSPKGDGQPSGELLSAIERGFQSFDNFRKTFSEAAVKLFGSGWAWLAAGDDGKLEIMPLGNAGNPLTQGREPLLTLDVWEHAYYIDYRNERPRFVEGYWNAVNWDFVAKNLAAAKK